MLRYQDRLIVKNDSLQYKDVFHKKNVPGITQYTTPVLFHPTAEQISSLSLFDHVWTRGDRYYKLSAEAYGDPMLWWVIAWFNQRPTEAHVKIGDTIQIPHPLDRVLRYFGV